MIVGVRSFDALLLHIATLEAALLEATGPFGTVGKNARGGADLRNGGAAALGGRTKLRNGKKVSMNQIDVWAKALDIQPYAGVSNMDCTVCEKSAGGKMLQCKYCELSQHRACCVPPVEETTEMDMWICPRCIRDVSELYATAYDTSGSPLA